MKKILALTFILILPLISFGQSDPKEPIYGRFNSEIPVFLFEGITTSIGVRGEGVLECYRGVKLSEVYYFSNKLCVVHKENGLEVSDADGTISSGLTEIKCKPRYDSSFISFNDKGYRGYISAVYEDSPAVIKLLNMVMIEDYLRGVLPAEIGDRPKDEIQSAEAQAVAARTYAVWRLTESHGNGRLAATVADQVYNGLDAEKESLNKAIDDTRGEIMTYNNHPIAAYYHAVCGGHTSPIQKVWPDKTPIPYLVGTDDKNYCKWAKSYSWKENFTLDDLKDNISKYFISKGSAQPGDFSQLIDIDFKTDDESKRVERIDIITGIGVFTETYDKIRRVFGRPSAPGAILPSTKFTVRKIFAGETFSGLEISGNGNGHGVGMCQCGAIGQSRLGIKYQDILKYYYHRIKIIKIY